LSVLEIERKLKENWTYQHTLSSFITGSSHKCSSYFKCCFKYRTNEIRIKAQFLKKH